MNNRTSNPPGHSKAFLPLLVGVVAGLTGIGLLAVMLWNAQMLVRLGLTGYVWFILLLLLGLAAAVTVFALFRSYARYSGKVLGGTLEIGGPAVAMFLVIALGFAYVPAPAQRFDLTVFLHGEPGRQAVVLRNSGKLSLDLVADRRTESVGDKGEARFVGIPADMRGRKANLALDADKYELVDPNLEVPLDQSVVYAAVRPKQLKLVGTVSDDRGKPLAQARVAVAGRATTTDGDGGFELTLPADLPDGDRTVTITAAGYETWRAMAALGGNRLQAQLSATSVAK